MFVMNAIVEFWETKSDEGGEEKISDVLLSVPRHLLQVGECVQIVKHFRN